MQHSVLGTRWVYDGLLDPRFVLMLAGVATHERGPVDGFQLVSDEASASVLRNDRFELTVYRRPVRGPRPSIGLTATWDTEGDAAILAVVQER